MKIKKCIDINLEKSNLEIYKLNNWTNKVDIKSIKTKENSKYVEVEYFLPKSSVSLVRSTSDTMTLYSYGYTPSSLYFISGSSLKNKASAQKINLIHKFNVKYPYEENTKDEIQYRKVERREEIEHRKNNINYKIKYMEKEDFKLKKVLKKDKDFINEMEEQEINTEINDEMDSNLVNKKIISSCSTIEAGIFKSCVVNYSDLVQIYQGDIKGCLLRCTTFYKGRYILKNKYYTKILQDIRDSILSEYTYTDIFRPTRVDEDYMTCLNELCIRDKEGYKLKGYYEESLLDYNSSELVEDIRKKGVCSVQEIKDMSRFDIEDVYAFISTNNLVELKHNLYCVEITKEIEEVIRLVERNEDIKKVDIQNILIKGIDSSMFIRVLEKYFVPKRGGWTIKKKI